MKRQYRRAIRQSKQRREHQRVVRESNRIQLAFSKKELIEELQSHVQDFAIRMGLRIGLEVIEKEVEELCGSRYSRDTATSRYGRQGGYIIVGGQKVGIERPRVRGDKEISLESYRLLQRPEALSQSVLSRMLRGVSTRDYNGTIETLEEGFGTERSSVSRLFVRATRNTIAEFEKRRFEENRFPIIFIDGIEYAEETLIVVLGVDSKGQKHLLGVRHGATENKEVCISLMEDLVQRGLDTGVATLFVIDGSKALRNAILALYGKRAIIQRCQVHKKRNVKAHVPEEHWDETNKRLSDAYSCSSNKEALKKLDTTARWLDRIAPDAASSLREGMEETVTVIKLGIPDLLKQSLSSTNVIESALSVSRNLTNRVKRWREGDMRKRWCISGLLRAEEKFQRIRGHRFLNQLIQSLDNHHLERFTLDSTKEAA